VRCITLTTDFGTQDWFAGTMKGVILRLAPQARIIDLTHEIGPGDIRAGAFALAASYAFFPRKTIHLAVVDPGVGTKRRAIAVETRNYFFVGPDNGLLSYALAREDIKAIHSLDDIRFFLPKVSSTFHGRDVFAPVAAHLSRGVAIRKLGVPVSDFICLDWPLPKISGGKIIGEVLYIDRFGNAITNISSPTLKQLRYQPAVFLKRKQICRVAAAYQDVAPGGFIAIMGSSGFLEVSTNGGNAAEQLGLSVGASIEVRPSVAR
jgi:S-adenosylmethionine hydrolase